MWGTAALDLAYVAAGRFDGFCEIDVKPWETAAGLVLIREAGGLVSQSDGSEYDLNAQNIVAANNILHGMVIEVLSRHE